MSHCAICCREITSERKLDSSNKICIQCSTNIKECNYMLIIENVNDDSNILLHVEDRNITPQQNNEEDLIFVGADRKTLSIKIDSEIAIERQENALDVSHNFKDALLASLYAQVEFLKQEIAEKNFKLFHILW